MTIAAGSFSTARNKVAWVSRGTTIGSREFLSELAWNISANDVLMTARNPYCISALLDGNPGGLHLSRIDVAAIAEFSDKDAKSYAL